MILIERLNEMQRLVNQVYWENSLDSYMYGTSLKMTPKNNIEFNNSLMAAGKTITEWQSSNNYQNTKTVPQLPLLQPGVSYRIKIHANSTPKNTLIVRIIFKDIQGNEIKRTEFQTEEEKFVFPSEAVFYQICLVNGGCIAINFKRIEICRDTIPAQANDDIWVHEMINPEKNRMMNIILIQDEKRGRSTTEYLKKYVDEETSVLPISIAWQAGDEVLPLLISWLKKQQFKNVRLISAMPAMDGIVLKIKDAISSISTLVTDQAGIGSSSKVDTYKFQVASPWYISEIVNPDWSNLFGYINSN